MKRILLIEDNAEVRENIVEILELSDYEVYTAANGREGIKQAQTLYPDLILCDVMMPVLDGYQVLEQLQKGTETEMIPFIFLTAKSKKAEVRKGMNLGADDYLTKPFEEHELLEAIKSRLRKSNFAEGRSLPDMVEAHELLPSTSHCLNLAHIEHDYHAKTYRRKDFVFIEGDAAHTLYYIGTGTVKTYKSTSSGKELVTGIHKSGDFLGQLSIFSTSCCYLETATVLDDAVIYRIPESDFMHILHERSDVMNRFFYMISDELKETQEELISMAYASVRERAAKALIRLRDGDYRKDMGSQGILINREDFASMIGTATETAIRTLSELREEGVIAMDRARRIIVMDRSKLAHIADVSQKSTSKAMKAMA